MTKQGLFEEGDELYVRFPEVPDKTYTVKAVKAKSDSYFCYCCVFFGRCRSYPGASPFSRHCYTTIFEIKK
ncbi:MAG: hypothetical protein HUK25_02520 [Treponema sp.]|nr:hypothetical protein [Treponema sp.]